MSANSRWARIRAMGLAAGLLATTLIGCGDNSSSWTPQVFSLDPPVPYTGTTKVSVYGDRFAPGAMMYWNGRRQATTFSSDRRLDVQLDIGATLTRGTGTVTVNNEGSYSSNEIKVTVQDAPLKATSLSPPAVPVGAADFTLTVSGTGFVPDSQVLWTGAPLQTRFSSSTQLTARVPAALVAVAGSGKVTVMNPNPCNGFFSGRCGSSNSVACLIGVGPGVGLNSVEQLANDLAWDSVHGLLFLSVPAYAPTYANTVSVLQPLGGTIVASVAATDPQMLTASDDGQYLYAGLGTYSGPSTVARYALPGLTSAGSWSRGSSAGRILDLQVAPGGSRTIAVSFGTDGLVILDDGVPRPKSVATYFGNFDSLQWGTAATQLFAAEGRTTGNRFYVLSVDASGAALGKVSGSVMFGSYSRIHHAGITRRIYGDLGEIVDEQGVSAGIFTGSPFSSCVMTPDGANGKAFFACVEADPQSQYSELTIRSFDLTRGAQIATVLLKSWRSNWDPPEIPSRIVRWGTNGLALATNGKLYLYSGPFVQ
jgi:hypothetical protein